MIPWRKWEGFHKRTLKGNYGISPPSNSYLGWTEDEFNYGIWGKHFYDAAPKYYEWKTIAKPSAASFILEEGANHIFDFRIDYYTLRTVYDGPAATATCPLNVVSETDLDYFECSGRWKAKPQIQWSFYPPPTTSGVYISDNIQLAASYEYHESWSCAYRSGVGAPTHAVQADLFASGLAWAWGIPSTPFGFGNHYQRSMVPQRLTAEYCNPVVNSLSKYQVSPAGGEQLILYGLGFDNLDSEINDTTKNSNNWLPEPWTDEVDKIIFIGLQGQGTYQLNRFPLGVDYTLDSNSQITIHSLPPMAKGTYEIFLEKVGVDNMGNVSAYAGDWRVKADGEMYKGTRFTLEVGPTSHKRPGQPIIFTKWRFKKGDAYIYRHYAEIDIRATEVFYDGRILNLSDLTRSIDDNTGLFTISDMTIELANTDLEFSKLLAEYQVKNQPVEIFHGWLGEPEGWKTFVARMLVDDVTLSGPKIEFKLKNVFQKYFKIRVPRYLATAEEYPNIHPDEVGKPMPEVLGAASHTTGEAPGAIRAVYVDTTDFTYLAARGSLHGIPQVYGDGVLMDPANYSIFYAHGGRTYIRFTSDQGSKKITFNSEGYMYPEWDSPNGYVQNPAYVLLFYLAFLMELPADELDFESFDTLAAIYETMGEEESAYLIIQDDQDGWQLLGEMLWTYGAKSFPANSGHLVCARKDISNFAADLFLWTQLDAKEFADRPMNYKEAINFVKAKWTYFPTANLFIGSAEYERAAAIADLETKIEPSGPWEFRWTMSETLVNQRVEEELLKRSYGDRRIGFAIGLQFFYDVDIFSNFRFQDPYGLNAAGAGDYGRYYYIDSLRYSLDQHGIAISGVDLQYLLRQYFILGDRTAQAANWSGASEEDRMYGYLCDRATGKFADGEPGKSLGSRE